uniref:IS3 family transposase n=1 Tax=Methylobacter psychrophilus TaxID=96941 RepID=UPI0021D4C2EC|nr:IS3 family transposase [Methylobacter psychrophilus]
MKLKLPVVLTGTAVYFMATTELNHHQYYQVRAEAKQNIFEYIGVFYNREQLHSTNNYLSPVDYEIQLKSA